ncbi:MAG: sigma factor [Clostridia bacterium]
MEFQQRPLCEPEQIVQVYADMVYRLAYGQTRSKIDADDIFQEVFFRCFRKQPLLESNEHQKAWFIRVTINCAKKTSGERVGSKMGAVR